MLQGVPKKSRDSWETITLGTSYSETTYLLDLKLWQQGVLMSTPCCQISTAYRLVVSEYEVPKVLVSQECTVFFETPCSRYYLTKATDLSVSRPFSNTFVLLPPCFLPTLLIERGMATNEQTCPNTSSFRNILLLLHFCFF